MEKEYTVYFHGKIKVDAESKEQAKQEADEFLADTTEDLEIEHTITSVEEGECTYCGGTGEVATDESDGEGHIMAGVGTQTCICQK